MPQALFLTSEDSSYFDTEVLMASFPQLSAGPRWQGALYCLHIHLLASLTSQTINHDASIWFLEGKQLRQYGKGSWTGTGISSPKWVVFWEQFFKVISKVCSSLDPGKKTLKEVLSHGPGFTS